MASYEPRTPRTHSNASTSRWRRGKRQYRQTAWRMISPGNRCCLERCVEAEGVRAAPASHRGESRRPPRRRSCVGGTRMPWCAEAVEGHAAVGNAVCPPPSPGAGHSHSERVSLGPGPSPQRWYAVSPVPARWRVGSRAHPQRRRYGWYAICSHHGGAQACSRLAGTCRSARGEAYPVHRLPGASAQFASLFLASLPRHVRRSGGFQDTCERTRFVPDAPRTR